MRAIFAERTDKVLGLRRGFTLGPEDRVIVIEDVVTTGGSALKAIARVREHGLKVGIILGIVDREEGGREALEKEAPLVTLFRRSDFL